MNRTATKKAAPAGAKDTGWAGDAVREHVAIHRPASSGGWWSVHRWSAARGAWLPAAPGIQAAPLLGAIEAVKYAIIHGHVTVADYELDIESLNLKEMDTVSPGRTFTFLCPEGNPDNPDLWTSLDISAGRAASMSSISQHTRFVTLQLEERLRALVLPSGDRDPSSPRTSQTYAVRRTFTARNLLPRENWGIVGNPELLAKRQAENEARAREAEAREEEGDGWITPRVISVARRR